jgi:hypothetical protein
MGFRTRKSVSFSDSDQFASLTRMDGLQLEQPEWLPQVPCYVIFGLSSDLWCSVGR